MCHSAENRSGFSLLNVAPVLQSTFEKYDCHNANYEVALHCFLAIGNLCDYNAENRRTLGTSSIIGSMIVVLEKCADRFSNPTDTSNVFLENDTSMDANTKIVNAALFAIEKLVYNNISIHSVIDHHKVCSVIAVLLRAVYSFFLGHAAGSIDGTRSQLNDIVKQASITIDTMSVIIRPSKAIFQELGVSAIVKSCMALAKS